MLIRGTIKSCMYVCMYVCIKVLSHFDQAKSLNVPQKW